MRAPVAQSESFPNVSQTYSVLKPYLVFNVAGLHPPTDQCRIDLRMAQCANGEAKSSSDR